MGIWGTGNQPSPANPAFESVTVERISPVHDELKIIEFVPLPMQDCLRSPFRVHFIQSHLDSLLLCTLKIQLPSGFAIGRLILIFRSGLFPFAKGERSKANINVSVLDGGYFCLVLLVNTGEVLCLICRNPFPLILLQAAFGY